MSLAITSLIVNADDFGLTPGVNRAVEELQNASALTSATLMAGGHAFDDAVERASAATGPGTGCHVVLVDGKSLATQGGVTSLVRDGLRFHDSLPRFLLDLQSGRIAEEEIEEEVTSQIRHVQAAGLRVTHVDTHKHTHLFPRVARPLMRAAAACGLTAVRNPFEPAWSARLTRGALLRKLEVTLLRSFEKTFQNLCKEYGMATTEGCIGVSATGRLDASTLKCLLDCAPAGTFELVCHPGYNDEALRAIRTRLRHTREIERQALLKLIPEAVSRGRIRLLTFADLPRH